MIDPSVHPYIVLITLAVVLVLLFKEVVKASIAFFLGVIVLVSTGIVKPTDFLNDLANPQIATIILLIIVTSALRKNYRTEQYLDKLFAGAKSPQGFMLRMSVFVSGISAFVNNTPLVAVMMPYVYSWCKTHGAHPSKLMIPLSYAAILGGMMTVIGTSTNLVLNGFLAKNNLPVLGSSDFFVVGFSITVLGTLYMYFFGYNLLPEYKEVFNEAKAKAPEYLMEVKVASPKLEGMTIKEAGLTNLKGIYLIELHRDMDIISPVKPEEILQLNDSLLFMGKPEKIMDLVNLGMGFAMPTQSNKTEIIEAVIPTGSSLIGKTPKECDFNHHFHAELVALHRKGEKIINKKLQFVHLEQGDMLLLSVNEEFVEDMDQGYDLYILSKIEHETSPKISLKAKIFLAIFSVLFVSIAFFDLPMLTGVLIMVFLLLLLDLFTYKDITEKVDLDLLLMLACALTLGNAMVTTGAAKQIADGVLSVFSVFGNQGLLIGIYFLTLVLTAFLTNAAAVSIAFPIAYSLSQQLGIEGTPFFMAIVFAASGDFMTPIGYQTNLMVYNAGGYKPKDFLRVGFPMTIIYTIVSIAIILFKYKL